MKNKADLYRMTLTSLYARGEHALLHSDLDSASNVRRDDVPLADNTSHILQYHIAHNQRLEFLGTRFATRCIFVFLSFISGGIGSEMTRWRTEIVREETLVVWQNHLIWRFLLLDEVKRFLERE